MHIRRYAGYLILIATVLVSLWVNLSPVQAIPTTYYLIAVGTTAGNQIGNANDNASGSTSCTLRDALFIVNAGTISGTVRGCNITAINGVPATPIYVINLPAYTYTLNGSTLSITANNVTVVGQGSANTIIQANAAANTAAYGVVSINGSATTVEFDGVTIRHGVGTSGGGISNNASTLRIKNITISANTAMSGGGIYNNVGTLTVDASTISANTAINNGGGIVNNGTLTIQNGSVIGGVGVGNTAMSGGGIFNSVGTLTVNDSSIVGNVLLTTEAEFIVIIAPT